MENELVPDQKRLKELLKKTDEKLLETSGEIQHDHIMIGALTNLYEAMQKIFVKKKLRKAIKESKTYSDIEYWCGKAVKNNKGYNFPTDEIRTKFNEYKQAYTDCFLELVRDDIRSRKNET